jgi:hypothetical protein
MMNGVSTGLKAFSETPSRVSVPGVHADGDGVGEEVGEEVEPEPVGLVGVAGVVETEDVVVTGPCIVLGQSFMKQLQAELTREIVSPLQWEQTKPGRSDGSVSTVVVKVAHNDAAGSGLPLSPFRQRSS